MNSLFMIGRSGETIVLVLLLTAFTWPVFGTTLSAPQLGIGFTNNVTMNDTDKHSDRYWRAGFNETITTSNGKFQASIFFQDYFEYDSFDALNWRLGLNRKDVFSKPWEFQAGLFGTHYTSHSPANTDQSFSHVGLQIKGLNRSILDRNLELSWGPAYELRRYLEVSKRTDHTAKIAASLTKPLGSQLSLEGLSELGTVLSSESDYRNLYVEVGAGLDFTFQPRWNWYNELTVRRTAFFNRKVSTETAVVRTRRGLVRSVSDERREAYTMSVLTSEVTYEIARDGKLAIAASHTSQKSISGTFDYSALELMAHAEWTF